MAISFTSRIIAPAGRNKYGHYISSGNVTRSVSTTTYAGNNTTTSLAEPEPQKPEIDSISFYCMLSKASVTYSALDLVEGVQDNSQVIAYRGYDKASTFICDMDGVTATTDSDGIITGIEAPANMGITGIPSGITVTIQNNGTTGTTLVFNADSTLTGSTGTIRIPVNIYKRQEAVPEANDLLDWYDSRDNCEQMWLEFVWNVNRAAAASYVLDLSNQTAGVNCDSAGTLYPNSIATLQCTATTYYNGAVATGVTYSASTQPAYAAIGYSIDSNTGVLTFNTAGTQFYWSTLYPALPIDIVAYKDGNSIATKTMTITRNYPGADGTPAHTRYIVTDYDAVLYDPNTSTYSTANVVGRVMLQVGDELPVYDSSTTIYQWYNDLESGKASASGSITASTSYSGVESITFALMNASNDYYEIEEVPIISAGTDGAAGASGESAWYLTLSNDNASINCDSDGNILPGAVKPTCEAVLYYGSEPKASATYTVDYGSATGVTTSVTSGVLSISFTNDFNFTGTTLNIAISGKTNGVVRDRKTMTITKSIAGQNGDDAVSYWLDASYGSIMFNPNTLEVSPSSITCSVSKQIGQGEIQPATEATIKYCWLSKTTGTWTAESAYTGTVAITVSNCLNYSRLRFSAYINTSVKVDSEDVEIIFDGVDGNQGESAWYLSLSNDNASINCDSDGNILHGAVRPGCEFRLYYGNMQIEDDYSISITDWYDGQNRRLDVSAFTITHVMDDDGSYSLLTIASSFTFTAATATLIFHAFDADNIEVDMKVMNIVKSYGGEDAVSYWLVPSYGSVIYNPNTSSATPSSISCEVFKQVGQQAVVPATDATIKYQWQNRSSGTWTTATPYASAIQVDATSCTTYSRLRFTATIGVDTQVDVEDVDIIADGLNGAQGNTGRSGPAIRGPYYYNDVYLSQRDWCNGETSSTISGSEKWIDVIVKDGVYYYCSTAYHGSIQPWSSYSSYWTSGDSFNFIATNLLLANDAKINFLSGNEIYLYNDDGELTAGARGGDGVAFWAGSEAPEDGNFIVTQEGDIHAKSGTFAGYIQMPYTFVSELTYSAATYTYYADSRAYLVSDMYNQSQLGGPANLVLPAPSQGRNGFTYDIIVEPRLTRSEDENASLSIKASDNSTIYCYAFSERRDSTNYILTGGRYVITCMPKRDNGQITYRWAITQSTGGLTVVYSNTTEFISNVVGSSFNTDFPISKIVTYTGNKPSVPNTNNTMYVKK